MPNKAEQESTAGRRLLAAYTDLVRTETKGMEKRLAAVKKLSDKDAEALGSFAELLAEERRTVFEKKPEKGFIFETDPAWQAHVGMYRIAQLLGVEELFTEVKSARDGNETGCLIKEQKGPTLKELLGSDTRPAFSTAALKQVLSLQVLDLLCARTGRRIGDLSVVLSGKGKNAVVEGFISTADKEAFLPVPYDQLRERGVVSTLRDIRGGGGIRIPGIDKELADRILMLKPEMADYLLLDVCDRKSRICFKSRLAGIQMAIARQRRYDAKHPEALKRVIAEEKDWEAVRVMLRKTGPSEWIAFTYLISDFFK